MRRATVLVALLCAVSAARAQAPAFGTLRQIVSQSEDGPPLADGDYFSPGETVFFSMEIAGYKVGPTGKVQLTGHIQAFDPKGIPIAVRDEEVVGTTLSEEDKGWKPKLRSTFIIPTIAPSGLYTIRFDVTDQQTKATAVGKVTFPVHSRAVEPAAALAIRNFHFYRTQDDESPLQNPAYQAGDMLWVKLDITGYRYGEQNSIDVTYDVEVLTPDGKSLFTQADAAVERSVAFYPQPWVPAEFNLTLQTTMTPGTYTLVITAHDGVGHQTATAKGAFKVE